MELEGADNHQVRRLFHFAPLAVDVGHAGGAGFVVGQVDLQHVGVSPQLKAFFLAQRRQNVHVRRGFRVHVAGVAAAETAEVARAHLRAVGVGIGVGGVGRRQVIGVIPHFQRRFFKQLRRPGVFLRRQREVVRAVRGEGVAAAAFADDLAFDRPGGPGSTEYFFRFIEERFQLVVGDAEILDDHILGDEVFAVAFFIVAAHPQLNGIDAEMDAGPVQPGAAHAGTRQEGRQLAIGHRLLAGVMPDGDGAFRQILEQLAADVVGQLINHLRIGAVRPGVAHRAALQRDDVEPGFGQLFGHDRPNPAEADDRDIGFFQYGGHDYTLSPLIDTGGKG